MEQKFKDGDVITLDDGTIAIIKSISLELGTATYHALLSVYTQRPLYDRSFYLKGRKPRMATDSENQQLLRKLMAEGKMFDFQKKEMTQLPNKYDFNTFDYILVRRRGEKYMIWTLHQFAFIRMFYDSIDHIRICTVGGYTFNVKGYEVLPYNSDTMHLLGTTDNYEQ